MALQSRGKGNRIQEETRRVIAPEARFETRGGRARGASRAGSRNGLDLNDRRAWHVRTLSGKGQRGLLLGIERQPGRPRHVRGSPLRLRTADVVELLHRGGATTRRSVDVAGLDRRSGGTRRPSQGGIIATNPPTNRGDDGFRLENPSTSIHHSSRRGSDSLTRDREFPRSNRTGERKIAIRHSHSAAFADPGD